MRIALVTYTDAPDLTPDDQLLQVALAASGVTAEAVIWDQPGIPWESFDLVLLRSPWDYFLRPTEFTAWIDEIERLGINLVNSAAVVRWNGDKRYLLQLESLGIATIPTALLESDGANHSLSDLLTERGWDHAVVKPAVSGGAHDTWRTSRARAASDQREFDAVRARASAGVLVQPFVEEVIGDGEWSLLFLDGEYSHAAIKRARGGDFRVQQAHGGIYSPATPPAAIIEQAGRVVAAGAACAGVEPADLAYARVDGVIRNGDRGQQLLLMELECIEPSLFFLEEPAAAERMAQSLIRRLARR